MPAQPIGVSDRDVSTMLCPNTQRRLSSSLIKRSVSLSRRIAIGEDQVTFPPPLNCAVAKESGRSADQGPYGFNDFGECTNEQKIITCCKDSTRFSVKGYYPEKNGIAPCRLAAAALKARRTSLVGHVSPSEVPIYQT
jgi:hypothetical protein